MNTTQRGPPNISGVDASIHKLLLNVPFHGFCLPKYFGRVASLSLNHIVGSVDGDTLIFSVHFLPSQSINSISAVSVAIVIIVTIRDLSLTSRRLVVKNRLANLLPRLGRFMAGPSVR